MIFLLLRQQQARSAILRFLFRKSTSNVNLFLNLSTKLRFNAFRQTLVSQQVLIKITADECAFYSISNPTQHLFLNYLFEWFSFVQFSLFYSYFDQICFQQRHSYAVNIKILSALF